MTDYFQVSLCIRFVKLLCFLAYLKDHFRTSSCMGFFSPIGPSCFRKYKDRQKLLVITSACCIAAESLTPCWKYLYKIVCVCMRWCCQLLVCEPPSHALCLSCLRVLWLMLDLAACLITSLPRIREHPSILTWIQMSVRPRRRVDNMLLSSPFL